MTHIVVRIPFSRVEREELGEDGMLGRIGQNLRLTARFDTSRSPNELVALVARVVPLRPSRSDDRDPAVDAYGNS